MLCSFRYAKMMMLFLDKQEVGRFLFMLQHAIEKQSKEERDSYKRLRMKKMEKDVSPGLTFFTTTSLPIGISVNFSLDYFVHVFDVSDEGFWVNRGWDIVKVGYKLGEDCQQNQHQKLKLNHIIPHGILLLLTSQPVKTVSKETKKCGVVEKY